MYVQKCSADFRGLFIGKDVAKFVDPWYVKEQAVYSDEIREWSVKPEGGTEAADDNPWNHLTYNNYCCSRKWTQFVAGFRANEFFRYPQTGVECPEYKYRGGYWKLQDNIDTNVDKIETEMRRWGCPIETKVGTPIFDDEGTSRDTYVCNGAETVTQRHHTQVLSTPTSDLALGKELAGAKCTRKAKIDKTVTPESDRSVCDSRLLEKGTGTAVMPGHTPNKMIRSEWTHPFCLKHADKVQAQTHTHHNLYHDPVGYPRNLFYKCFQFSSDERCNYNEGDAAYPYKTTSDRRWKWRMICDLLKGCGMACEMSPNDEVNDFTDPPTLYIRGRGRDCPGSMKDCPPFAKDCPLREKANIIIGGALRAEVVSPKGCAKCVEGHPLPQGGSMAEENSKVDHPQFTYTQTLSLVNQTKLKIYRPFDLTYAEKRACAASERCMESKRAENCAAMGVAGLNRMAAGLHGIEKEALTSLVLPEKATDVHLGNFRWPVKTPETLSVSAKTFEEFKVGQYKTIRLFSWQSTRIWNPLASLTDDPFEESKFTLAPGYAQLWYDQGLAEREQRFKKYVYQVNQRKRFPWSIENIIYCNAPWRRGIAGIDSASWSSDNWKALLK
jgi:hypothetical protein